LPNLSENFEVEIKCETEPDQAEQPSTQIARMVLPSCFGGEKLKKPVKAKVPLDSEDPILALLK
jgi:hypothetical protein